MKTLISIVAPMYNEELLARQFCNETMLALEDVREKYDFEIILVNDGSKDNTLEKMLSERSSNQAEITVISLSRNFGLEGAVNAGLRMATGDAVVVMDADLQDPPCLIPKMLKKMEEGADIVVCNRMARPHDTFFKKLGAGVYYKILDSLSGKLKLEKNAANFRLLTRKAVQQLLAMPEVNPVFRVVVPFIGMKTAVVEYNRDKRFAGKTKYNLTKMIPYALNSITGISVEPLRKIVFLVPIMFCLTLFFLLSGIFTHGISKIMVLFLSFLSFWIGIGFGVLAILAEYLAQIMIEVKGRPVSIIDEYIPAENAKGRQKA